MVIQQIMQFESLLRLYIILCIVACLYSIITCSHLLISQILYNILCIQLLYTYYIMICMCKQPSTRAPSNAFSSMAVMCIIELLVLCIG